MNNLISPLELLAARNDSAPQVATPTHTVQAPNFSVPNPNHLLPHMQAPPQLHVASTPAFPSLPSTPSPTRIPTLTPLSLSPVFPAHPLPAHPLPASALPPFSTSQLPNGTIADQLQATPQILELLNLIQMVQGQNLKAPIDPQTTSSTQSPVSRVIHAESNSQTEGPICVDRAASPTAPLGIVGMEEEMQTLKNDKEQLQKMYDSDVKKFELNKRQMSEDHQKTVTEMNETMKRLEDDFKKLSSADKKIIRDLKRDGGQRDAKIDALVQKNKQLEAEKESLMDENENIKIQMIGIKGRKGLQILYFRTDIRTLLDENYQLMAEKKSIESEYEERNQTLLRVQSELSDLTRKLQAQEEELQELRDFKINVEADKKEEKRQLEMTHSNVVTAALPLKKSESPAYNPGFEDDGYLHEETVYTEMSEEIAKMPKEEKFSEVLEKQKDDNETELMEKHSLEGLIQERLMLVGHIQQFKKKLNALRSECSTLEKNIPSMRSSLQRLQFLKDAEVAQVEDLKKQVQCLRAEVSNLQRQAKGFLNLTEHQQMLGRYQKMIKIYEDHSEKVVIFNNGRFYWKAKQGQSGTSDQGRAAKRPRQ
ncbi:unnamed protein product [Caenorhabditis nigoni]